MTTGRILRSTLLWSLVCLILLVQLGPLIVVVLVSFSASASFNLPTGMPSLRWYERLLTTSGVWPSFLLSAQIAALSTLTSLVLGSLCAVAIVRGRFRGSQAVAAALLSPLMLPGLVLGIAMLQGFRAYGLRAAWPSLLLAHVIVTLPFVVRIVMAALERFDFTLIDAARTLGVSYTGALWKVLAPNLVPAMLTSGLFAFLASFDNYAVSMFLVDSRNMTLPVRMLEMIEVSSDPRIAALSTVLLVMALVAVLAIERLVGLRRMAGR